VLFSLGGRAGGRGHVQQGHDGNGHDYLAQAAERLAPGGQRHQERRAERGPAEHDHCGRYVLDGHPDNRNELPQMTDVAANSNSDFRVTAPALPG
jgi:hypothetical protein